MKVIRAKVLGFCMGVRRAVDLALGESDCSGRKVYTLGPLIHNPDVLETLKKRGIAVLEENEAPLKAETASVILRAHGVPPEVEKKLAGVRVLDATCPHVKSSQNQARGLSAQGFHIFLAGEKDHGEIIGITGYVDGPCSVVANPLEAEEAAKALAAAFAGKNPEARTALLAQTTISAEEYRAIADAIKRHFPNLELINTICGATRERQDALRELSSKVDAFVVAGGRESANTRRLLAIAEGCGKKAWLVENAAEIPPEVSSFKVIGLSAGASTPDSIIDEIEERLLSLSH